MVGQETLCSIQAALSPLPRSKVAIAPPCSHTMLQVGGHSGSASGNLLWHKGAHLYMNQHIPNQLLGLWLWACLQSRHVLAVRDGTCYDIRVASW